MERRRDIQVGILFILAVAVLIMGILWFKEFRLGGQYYLARVEFENTSGLQRGDAVEVRGVSSGQVEEIVYEAGRAIVVLKLERSVEIYPETRFVIENVGIMGQKLVAVYPGPRGTPLATDVIFRGEYQPGIPALMADLGTALDSFQGLAERLDRVMRSFEEEDDGRFHRILDNTDRLTAELAAFLKETRGELTVLVRNTNSAMENLNSALSGRGEDVGTALERASVALARLDSTLVTFDRTMGRADSLLAGVQSGEGTLGRLARDPELYDNLRRTLEEAQWLIGDMRENPRKYLKFSVF